MKPTMGGAPKGTPESSTDGATAVRRAFGLLVGTASTLAGIGLGAWLAVIAFESYLPGIGFAAIPLLAVLELVFGGAGLILGYRAYFLIASPRRHPHGRRT